MGDADASPPPVDLGSASAVVHDAFSNFAKCAMTFEPIAKATSAVLGEEEALEASLVPSIASLPPPAFTGLWLLLGCVLLFFGFTFVRPINLFVGAYLGGTVSILMLTMLAPSTTCDTAVLVPVLVALVLGALFAWKRGSMFAVFGLLAGEVVGRLFFTLVLQPLGAPEYVAFTSIGFFAVLCACSLFYMGDLAWTIGCALAGAYLLVTNTLTLAVLPYFPATHLERFVAFKWPDVTRVGDSYYHHQYLLYLTSDPAIYAPLLLVCVLCAAGTRMQLKWLAQKKRQQLVAKSKAAALQME